MGADPSIDVANQCLEQSGTKPEIPRGKWHEQQHLLESCFINPAVRESVRGPVVSNSDSRVHLAVSEHLSTS
ncbi:hypothetical protein MRB53_016042 [Persea americana]|uniref:Uncharacterized protein n=1 Tax=Persea americana TaxID=3435 RepID=A0ACC2M1N3_PERAE|nr:hypothetical protein MRB53_016042 [Persea americana]